jgi:hypothetical protein
MLSEEKQISDGKVITRLEVTKIDKTPLDAAKVSIPEDYKKFEE